MDEFSGETFESKLDRIDHGMEIYASVEEGIDFYWR